MESEAGLVLLEPDDQLVFVGPFTRQLHNCIKITNPNKNSEVLFKIKTTAPRLYCVRPNSGALSPEEAVDIQITLQPFNFESNLLSKGHKFLIQAVQSPDSVQNVNDFWKEVDPNDVWDAKIKCVLTLDSKESHNQKAGNIISKPEMDLADVVDYIKNDSDGTENKTKNCCMKPMGGLSEYANGKMLEEELIELRKQVQFLEIEYSTVVKDLQNLNDVMCKDSVETKRQMQVITRRNGNFFYAMITMVFAILSAYIGKYMM